MTVHAMGEHGLNYDIDKKLDAKNFHAKQKPQKEGHKTT